MRHSMTGFAAGQGQASGLAWSWDLRSVNGRGLDTRVRVPDWIDGLDQALRAVISKRVARGAVTVSLRLHSTGTDSAQELKTAQLERVLTALQQVEAEAVARGVTLTASSGVDVLGFRGVMDTPHNPTDPEALRAVLLADFDPVLDSFIAARCSEGAALAAVLTGQIDQIAALISACETAIEARKDDQARRLRAALCRALEAHEAHEAHEAVDEQRLAQELALIAVKTDVTEELDRLRAHVNAAHALLQTKGAVGRKLDFLMQEFNREANTLCSKSHSTVLTALGLDLKTVIEQMREQVQNME